MTSVPDSPPATRPPPSPPPPPPAGDGPNAPPHWPLWTPLVAIAIGASAGFVILGALAAVLQSAGVDLDGDAPGFTAAGTALLDVCIVVAAVGVATRASRPVRPALWQFGLRRGPLGYSIGLTFTALLAFFIFELSYIAILNPDNPQTVAEDLGTDRSTLLLVLGAFVVIAVAPVCEELFFRGFLFRVLRLRMSFWLAAAIDGVLFGLVHGSLVILPVLAFLGVALCWLYARTGTLFAPIAIHVLNNTIAYGAIADDGWSAALPMGAAMIAACLLAPLLLPRRTPAPV